MIQMDMRLVMNISKKLAVIYARYSKIVLYSVLAGMNSLLFSKAKTTETGMNC